MNEMTEAEQVLEPGSVVLDLGSAAGVEWTDDNDSDIYYRRLLPGDMEQCTALHRSLFPIEYEQDFYTSAVSEANGIITLVAMQRQSRRETGGGGGGGGGGSAPSGGGGGGGGGEEGASGSSDAARAATFTQGAGDVLIGVVTARVTGAVEIEDVDVERWLPGGGDNGALARIFGGGGMDNGDNASTSYEGDVSTAPFLPPSTPYAYILTLGTLASHRRLGIASKLLERVVTRARHEHGCKVVYLHVITHNEGAIRFYRGHRFAQVRRLANFYTIPDAAAKGGGEDGVVQLAHHDSYLLVRCARVDPRRAAATSPLAALAAAWEALWRLAVAVVVGVRRSVSARGSVKKRSEHREL